MFVHHRECTNYYWIVHPIKWLFYVALFVWISPKKKRGLKVLLEILRQIGIPSFQAGIPCFHNKIDKEGISLALMHIAFLVRWTVFSNTATSFWIWHSALGRNAAMCQMGIKRWLRPDSGECGNQQVMPSWSGYPSAQVDGIRPDEWLLHYLLKSFIS